MRQAQERKTAPAGAVLVNRVMLGRATTQHRGHQRYQRKQHPPGAAMPGRATGATPCACAAACTDRSSAAAGVLADAGEIDAERLTLGAVGMWNLKHRAAHAVGQRAEAHR